MPFKTITLDFIVKLPVSQGFDSILTITDQGCMKAAIFIPCCYVSMACIAQLEWVPDDGYLDVRIGSAL
jgi:hypothetical protein